MRCGTGATINGGKKLPQDHVQKTKTLLESLLHDTMSLLIMPTLTRGGIDSPRMDASWHCSM